MTVKVSHINSCIEAWAPSSTKLDYDNVGLLIGSPDCTVSKLLLSLDLTPEVVDEAVKLDCEMILSHHPVIFRGIRNILPETQQGETLYKAIRHNIAIAAAHTNLDAAKGGVSYALAQTLGLESLSFLEKIRIPQTSGSAPDAGMGVVGNLPGGEMGKEAFLDHVASRLEVKALRYSGQATRVSRVAVCGGAGVSLAGEARKQGAQAFVTADVKYHDYFPDDPSFLLIDAGHYESEIPVIPVVQERLKQAFPELEVIRTSVVTNPMSIHLNPESNSTQINVNDTRNL